MRRLASIIAGAIVGLIFGAVLVAFAVNGPMPGSGEGGGFSRSIAPGAHFTYDPLTDRFGIGIPRGIARLINGVPETLPAGTLHVMRAGGTEQASLVLETGSSTTGRDSVFVTRKHSGDGFTPSNVVVGTLLGTWQQTGLGANVWRDAQIGAGGNEGGFVIECKATQTWTTFFGTQCGFYTSITGDTALSERMRFGGSGAVFIPNSTLIGTLVAGALPDPATDPAARLEIQQLAEGNELLRLVTAATNDDPTFHWATWDGTTTNSSATNIGGPTLTASKTYQVVAQVVARRTGGSAGAADDGGAYFIKAAVKGTGPAIIAQAGMGGDLESQAGWGATFAVSGSTVQVQVTGATNNNVTWHAHVWWMEVGT